jgi:hypothetical protein
MYIDLNQLVPNNSFKPTPLRGAAQFRRLALQ